MKFRSALFNLRCSVLNINIEIGRFENIPSEEMIYQNVLCIL